MTAHSEHLDLLKDETLNNIDWALYSMIKIQQQQINDLNARIQILIMQSSQPKLLKAPSWTP